ncbi:hypothetical protein IHE45_10G051700 [Dioscorea alata]|uniref:Uncharacterized protein n=1 Tax=Dioscorea alata TaxID=55571 RepID=A0ACB7VB28_DIOAL|nr:hypothetical protein IHE45_10G051700 [Dioscorea alata]
MEIHHADNVKRYAPPAQRNRALGRRKSGEKVDKMNYCYGTDPEKIQASYSRNPPVVDQGDLGNSYYQNDSMNSRLIPLDGCSNSEAAHLLNERWLAAMNSYNDPSDLSEKPFMYTGASGSSWGHFKLPHQMDFISDLQRAMSNAHSNKVPVVGEDN